MAALGVVDEAEQQRAVQVGDEVLHIELRRWADVLLIAPLSANTLAKVRQTHPPAASLVEPQRQPAAGGRKR